MGDLERKGRWGAGGSRAFAGTVVSEVSGKKKGEGGMAGSGQVGPHESRYIIVVTTVAKT